MISKRSKQYRGAMGAYARSRNVWQRRHAELTVKYEARGRLLKEKRKRIRVLVEKVNRIIRRLQEARAERLVEP